MRSAREHERDQGARRRGRRTRWPSWSRRRDRLSPDAGHASRRTYTHRGLDFPDLDAAAARRGWRSRSRLCTRAAGVHPPRSMPSMRLPAMPAARRVGGRSRDGGRCAQGSSPSRGRDACEKVGRAAVGARSPTATEGRRRATARRRSPSPARRGQGGRATSRSRRERCSARLSLAQDEVLDSAAHLYVEGANGRCRGRRPDARSACSERAWARHGLELAPPAFDITICSATCSIRAGNARGSVVMAQADPRPRGAEPFEERSPGKWGQSESRPSELPMRSRWLRWAGGVRRPRSRRWRPPLRRASASRTSSAAALR